MSVCLQKPSTVALPVSPLVLTRIAYLVGGCPEDSELEVDTDAPAKWAKSCGKS
jgi:hypothetical protein